jgi:hypothetical protein
MSGGMQTGAQKLTARVSDDRIVEILGRLIGEAAARRLRARSTQTVKPTIGGKRPVKNAR